MTLQLTNAFVAAGNHPKSEFVFKDLQSNTRACAQKMSYMQRSSVASSRPATRSSPAAGFTEVEPSRTEHWGHVRITGNDLLSGPMTFAEDPATLATGEAREEPIKHPMIQGR